MISVPPDSALRRTIDVAAATQNVTLNYTTVLYQYTSCSISSPQALNLHRPCIGAAGFKNPQIVVKPLRPAITRQIGILHLAETAVTRIASIPEIFRPLSPRPSAILNDEGGWSHSA